MVKIITVVMGTEFTHTLPAKDAPGWIDNFVKLWLEVTNEFTIKVEAN